MQLSVPSVRLTPSLDDVQRAINRSAVAVIGCSKQMWQWGQLHIPEVGLDGEQLKTSYFEVRLYFICITKGENMFIYLFFISFIFKY